MATLWSFVGLADVGDFEQPSEGPAPSFAGGLRIAISRPEKVTRIAAGQMLAEPPQYPVGLERKRERQSWHERKIFLSSLSRSVPR
jgi:hypothetical protein